MVSDSLHSLFTSSFYINEAYGVSLIPSLLSSVNTSQDISKNDLILKIQKVEEVNANDKAGKIVVLDFIQPVVKYSYGYWLGTQDYIKILDNIQRSPDVIGVVLNIDSGGGQVYGTGEFYDFIKDYKKPIVAYTGGYMCSGAYYFAAASDWIIANSRADAIGSIGAYSTIVDYSGMLEKFGAKIHVMYASKSEEKNANYRKVIENSEYEDYIKNELDPIVEDFHTDMISARPNLNNKVFKGATWNGKDSLQLGLIDEIGTLQTAINKVYELSNKNTTKKTQMSKSINVPAIQNVLGYTEAIGCNENGVYLQESEVALIEAALNDNTTAQSSLQTSLDTANTKVNDAENVINAALDNAEITYSEENSLSEKITMLNNQRNEFATKAAGTPTQVAADVDANNDKEEVVIYSHDEDAKKILNIN